ncbi:uncharacterized protein LOC9633557 [Selaginella moellendorffii]|uniref:uncharacterized protein LOC9633557 n=1 Tax=Selaginella moellendorffii TaxID=88036 RepID=UPI000D1C79C9|nr:uncharacterized protein LOC9633557 [Selaginella moellendorffii]|eukprot:XP_024531565.1 uncharacterized protein LOC9633557 [Selaginella moellendorffii]
MACDSSTIAEGVERCPFLRNIGEPTSFNFSSFAPIKFPNPLRGSRGPIFEDGPGFDTAFRLFHGKDGVIPLSRNKADDGAETLEVPKMGFHPLAASAATISLSSFGAGRFNFDAFMAKQQKKKKERKESESKQNKDHLHEALGSEWLATGNCPIARSCRAVSGVLPLVAKWFKPPSGMKYRCPPAIVAARAALARTAFAKNLRPQPLPSKLLAIGLLGMATNVPLGVWREHTKKFSPEWFVAVHAAVPFIAMMRKAVNMPKLAMAFTIGASILGQVIGSRAERIRLAQAKLAANGPGVVTEICLSRDNNRASSTIARGKSSSPPALLVGDRSSASGSGGEAEEQIDSLNHQCAKLVWDEFKSPVSRTVDAF